ncbi:MAG: hypothetical protein ACRD1T_00565 [Acidimicrobiia bacterium]
MFLQWDPERGPRELDALAERLHGCPELEPTIVLVDNRSPDAPNARNTNANLVVGGDNRAWEFSGLEVGVEAGRKSGRPIDAWLLVNDRYRADNRPFLRYLTGPTVAATCAVGGIVGHIDSYQTEVESFGWTIRQWVTSSFLLMSDLVLRRSAPLVMVDAQQLEAILGPPEETAFKTNGPIGSAHNAYLLDWLTGARRTDLATRWYGAAEIDQLDALTLRRKVQSILNEQLLSARAISQGIPLVPIEVAYRLGALGLDHPVVRREMQLIASEPTRHPLIRGSRLARLRLAMNVGLRHG